MFYASSTQADGAPSPRLGTDRPMPITLRDARRETPERRRFLGARGGRRVRKRNPHPLRLFPLPRSVSDDAWGSARLVAVRSGGAFVGLNLLEQTSDL